MHIIFIKLLTRVMFEIHSTLLIFFISGAEKQGSSIHPKAQEIKTRVWKNINDFNSLLFSESQELALYRYQMFKKMKELLTKFL